MGTSPLPPLRRFHTQWSSELSRTGEVDVLVPGPLAAGARPPISKLLAEAGFVPTAEARAAAVWEKDPVAGESIEFLVRHQGTARQIGQTTIVAGQSGLGAIALTEMDLQMKHVTTLRVPVTRDQRVDALEIRVPTLGAYIVTKSATFVRRRPIVEHGITRGNPKAGKDLVYIRDLMAAGDEVTGRIRADLARLQKDSKGSRRYLETAQARLTEILGSDPQGIIELAARELAERDRLTLGAARASIVGYLTDGAEMLGA
jgi:hypothetical protein